MKPLPISIKEFGQMLVSSCPSTGWGNVIAVAHSGGADSTCLLYLLHRLVFEHHESRIPRKLLALSVDHSLQSGSAAVAEHCRRFSESLQIPHVTLRIPWAHPPFPGLPEEGRPIESIARAARYRLLMDAMKSNSATVMALGHHADDQVETLLMRLIRNNSSRAVPTGMRKCRRWGMGSKSAGVDWAGVAGLHRWIVRPLLGVSKERILATCELHKLNYVDDPTNFQPSLTPRNYIRHFFSNNAPHPNRDPVSAPPFQRSDLQEDPTTLPTVKALESAIQRLDMIATELPGARKDASRTERLFVAANHLAQLRDNNDHKVTRYLNDFTRVSPPSTLLLCPPSQSSHPPPEIQREIVLRILRFVSPRPWGSPCSEASRRSSSLDLISDRLWNSSLETQKTFSAGSEVVWRPVSLREDRRIRLALDKQDASQFKGWLASRQPPIKRTGDPSPCVQDISGILASHGIEEVLWDNRFLLKLRPRLLPPDILQSCNSPGSVMVLPHGMWLLPKIVWLREGREELLAGVGLQVEAASRSSEWVDFEWIRPLDAI